MRERLDSLKDILNMGLAWFFGGGIFNGGGGAGTLLRPLRLLPPPASQSSILHSPGGWGWPKRK